MNRRDQRRTRRLNKLCPRCGGKPSGGFACCAACREYSRKAQLKHSARRRAGIPAEPPARRTAADGFLSGYFDSPRHMKHWRALQHGKRTKPFTPREAEADRRDEYADLSFIALLRRIA